MSETSDRERIHFSKLHREWCDPDCDGAKCEFIDDVLAHEQQPRAAAFKEAAEVVSLAADAKHVGASADYASGFRSGIDVAVMRIDRMAEASAQEETK